MSLISAYELLGKPRLLIVDGAGTLFDPGSVVPAYAFQATFLGKGIRVEFDTVMKYMGRQKMEHVKFLLNEPEVLEQFQKQFNRKPNENDVEEFYSGFKEQLYASAIKTKEINKVKDAAYRLKEWGIPLIMTTGYDRRMVDETRKNLPWLDEVLVDSITSSDVKKGRPAPFMIYHAMESALVENPGYAVKVGDTKVDIEAADNAYMPGVIVISGSIRDKQKAEDINKEFNRKHLVASSLVDVISYILDGTLVDRIKKLNR